MQRERIAEGIYVLTCERYFGVTAGVIVTDNGVVVVDTFPFPAESQALRDFALAQNAGPIRYVVLTHSHGDHSYGSYLFPDAELVAQDECRGLMERAGQQGLEKAKEETPELEPVRLRLPQITVKERGGLHLGQRALDLIHLPGHTRDGLGVYVREEKALFAGDLVMPVPYIPHGDPEEMTLSLKRVRRMGIDHLIQGHGEPLLRGEVKETVNASIKYLNTIQKRVQDLVARDAPVENLANITLEACGLGRILVSSPMEQLHRANLLHLYRQYRAGRGS